jgi:hypothetical protein
MAFVPDLERIAGYAEKEKAELLLLLIKIIILQMIRTNKKAPDFSEALLPSTLRLQTRLSKV